MSFALLISLVTLDLVVQKSVRFITVNGKSVDSVDTFENLPCVNKYLIKFVLEGLCALRLMV
jgi:hypothetical protein